MPNGWSPGFSPALITRLFLALAVTFRLMVLSGRGLLNAQITFWDPEEYQCRRAPSRADMTSRRAGRSWTRSPPSTQPRGGGAQWGVPKPGAPWLGPQREQVVLGSMWVNRYPCSHTPKISVCGSCYPGSGCIPGSLLPCRPSFRACTVYAHPGQRLLVSPRHEQCSLLWFYSHSCAAGAGAV